MSAIHAAVPLRSLSSTHQDLSASNPHRFLFAWPDSYALRNDVISGFPCKPEVTLSDSQQRATLVGTLPGTGRILCGVAVLANELYVVRNFSSVVDVYDVRTRNFRSVPRGVDVIGLRDPVDIAACPILRTIYVSGSNDLSIFKIDGRSKTVTGRWRLDRRPFGVSVSGRRATVIVTFLDETAVKEFTSDGKELRGIRLDPELFANPWHAVALCGACGGDGGAAVKDMDLVLVCHGWSKDTLTCASVIDISEGHLLARYGGTRGSGAEAMDLPSHAVLDPRRGHVLVVDLNNNRVLRLRLPDTSGTSPEVESVLLSDADGLKWPRSLAVDVVQQRLFVGLHEGPVLIFDFRSN